MKYRSKALRNIRSVLFVSLFIAFSISAFGQNEVPSIQYRIKPVPVADRTNFEISVGFKAENTSPFNARLPVDCFGMPNILYRYVTNFEGASGTTVKAAEKENERVIQPAADGSVSLRYAISYDPAEMEKHPYSPNTSSNHFHLGGCQWLLRIGDQDKKRKHSVEIVDAPSNWKFYSSISPNVTHFETVDTHRNLISSGMGGGMRSHFFRVKGKPVSVFVHGNLDIQDRDIFRAVEKIVRFQRDWFEDHSQPFYAIAVSQRAFTRSGYAPNNAFFCFIKKDTSLEDLIRLMSHEMAHTWFHERFLQREKDVSSLRHAWFFEGFNDYVARKILLDAKLITLEQFVASFNRDIIAIADNVHRAATLDDLLQAAKAGKFGQARTKLSYSRGALMALAWEAQIRNLGKGRSLGGLVKEASLISRTDTLTEDGFLKLAEKYGIDAKGDFEKYIVRGEPIRIVPDSFGRQYELRETQASSFDPGFALDESLDTGKITGVRIEGPAYRAGLRDSMKVLNDENANRYGNSWDPNKPMAITVEIDGKPRRIEFFPHGTPHKLQLFQKSEK